MPASRDLPRAGLPIVMINKGASSYDDLTIALALVHVNYLTIRKKYQKLQAYASVEAVSLSA